MSYKFLLTAKLCESKVSPFSQKRLPRFRLSLRDVGPGGNVVNLSPLLFIPLTIRVQSRQRLLPATGNEPAFQRQAPRNRALVCVL